MPRRRMRKRSFKRRRSMSRKRTRKRRRGNSMGANRRSSLVNRSPSFMPDTYMTTLVFAEQSSLSFIAAVQAQLSYTATGLFDPSPASGTQPVGFFELMGIYKKYQVTGCAIDLTLTNPVIGNPLSASLIPTQSFTHPNLDATDVAANVYAKSKYIGLSGSSTDTWHVKHYASSKAIFGQNINLTDQFWGTSAANPALNWAWLFNLTYPDNQDTVVHFQIKLTFYCRFSRKEFIDPTSPAAAIPAHDHP